MTNRIRVGFIGLNPDSNWASTAHLPALKALSDQFEIVGVANSSIESARRTAAALGLAHAFDSADALVASNEVDLVVVTVKVPHHGELVSKALNAGKHVYCEWPLGNGLAEAEALADLAGAKGVVAAVGTQARVAPEVRYLEQLVADGYVGTVLSTTILGDGGNWGAATSQAHAYLYDKANGADMLMIPMGHTVAALRDVLGEVDAVQARSSILRPDVTVTDGGDSFIRTAADDILVIGSLASGAALSVHYRGGVSRGTNFLWEINGTEGDIRVTARLGHAQMVLLKLEGARGDDREMQPLTVPAALYEGLAEDLPARNVSGVYVRIADDIRNKTQTAPSFRDAVALHRVLDRIDRAG